MIMIDKAWNKIEGIESEARSKTTDAVGLFTRRSLINFYDGERSFGAAPANIHEITVKLTLNLGFFYE
jgi:hypothetical protein